jgi:hypothetical protein
MVSYCQRCLAFYLTSQTSAQLVVLLASHRLRTAPSQLHGAVAVKLPVTHGRARLCMNQVCMPFRDCIALLGYTINIEAFAES